jgi:hypothetical protein
MVISAHEMFLRHLVPAETDNPRRIPLLRHDAKLAAHF